MSLKVQVWYRRFGKRNESYGKAVENMERVDSNNSGKCWVGFKVATPITW